MPPDVWKPPPPPPPPTIKKLTSLRTFVSFQGNLLNQPSLKIGIFGQTSLKLNLEILLKGPCSQNTK